VVELELSDGERQAAAVQHPGDETLPAEARELLHYARYRIVREVEAAVDVGIVVPALTLVCAREPKRAVRVSRPGAAVPGEAPIKDQAKESVRSARIARISSSALPARTRSIGRRSPSTGLSPKSHERATSGS